jgi:dihydropyrimidinase
VHASFRKGVGALGKSLFSGGTVVTAEGSYNADVLVADEKIVAVGTDLDAEGAETVDASGKLVMPGFIDAHTHMDMPFGGTVTADDWTTGTEAAAAGGTTMILDFALQEVGGTLAGAFETWTEKARDKAVIDYGFHLAITDLRDDIKTELPDLVEKGIASVKIFMAYKGTPLHTEDDDLFEVLQLSKDAGVLVLVHAENGHAIAKLQEQALSRGDTAPRFHALTRPEPVEAEATNRAIRLAEVAGAPILAVHVSCAPALEAIHLAHERGQTVYAETCPQYFAFEYEDLAREGFEGAKYVCSPPLRDPGNRPALWNGLKFGDLQIFGSDHCSFDYEGQKELGKDDFTLIPNGLPGVEERAMTLWTLGVHEGKLSENQFVAILSTNQARIYGAYPRKGTLAPGADADIVLWDPELSTTATVENRHGNVDYTPYEGMEFHGGAAAVYVRGGLVYTDGEVVGERGSGRFVGRSFTATEGLEVRV